MVWENTINLKNKQLKNLLQEFQPSYSQPSIHISNSMSFKACFPAVYSVTKTPNQKTLAKIKDNCAGAKMIPNKITEFYARHY